MDSMTSFVSDVQKHEPVIIRRAMNWTQSCERLQVAELIRENKSLRPRLVNDLLHSEDPAIVFAGLYFYDLLSERGKQKAFGSVDRLTAKGYKFVRHYALGRVAKSRFTSRERLRELAVFREGQIGGYYDTTIQRNAARTLLQNVTITDEELKIVAIKACCDEEKYEASRRLVESISGNLIEAINAMQNARENGSVLAIEKMLEHAVKLGKIALVDLENSINMFKGVVRRKLCKLLFSQLGTDRISAYLTHQDFEVGEAAAIELFKRGECVRGMKKFMHVEELGQQLRDLDRIERTKDKARLWKIVLGSESLIVQETALKKIFLGEKREQLEECCASPRKVLRRAAMEELFFRDYTIGFDHLEPFFCNVFLTQAQETIIVVENALRQLQAERHDVVGIALNGSLSSGYYIPGISDIDYAVVSENPEAVKSFRRIAECFGLPLCQNPADKNIANQTCGLERLFSSVFFGDHKTLRRMQAEALETITQSQWDEEVNTFMYEETRIDKGFERARIPESEHDRIRALILLNRAPPASLKNAFEQVQSAE